MVGSFLQLVVAMSPAVIFQGHGIEFEKERYKKDGGKKEALAKYGSLNEGVA